MHNLLKMGALAMFVIAATSPVAAHGGKTAEWWLVIDDSNPQIAKFVDLGSISQSDGGANISTMTISQSDNRKIQTLTVDCERMLGASGDASVKEFVCGTEEYRNSNGVILGPVSPDEMAAVVFAGQSDDASGNSRAVT